MPEILECNVEPLSYERNEAAARTRSNASHEEALFRNKGPLLGYRSACHLSLQEFSQYNLIWAGNFQEQSFIGKVPNESLVRPSMGL